MKLTQILFKQNLGRMTRRHWIFQGRRFPQDTGAEKVLNEAGIPVYDPQKILDERKPLEWINVVGQIPPQQKLDESHPDWHDQPCHMYKDNNFLLEGLDQAKVLTKTIEVQEGLPTEYELPQCTKEVDTKVISIIANAHLYDAEQVKLPKIKDPKRPAYTFPRILGISDVRKNNIITTKLLHLVERLSSNKSLDRSIIDDAKFFHNFKIEDNLYQLQLRGDKLVTSKEPIKEITTLYTDNIDVPELFPLKPNISISTENIYKLKTLYPINLKFPKSHPHTIFINYNKSEVANLFEEPPTESQILSLSLMKTFAAAASYAKNKFGEEIKILPKPVTVQCIQTDGQLFHFGVLQLNTLDMSDGGAKNVWYHKPRIPLFTQCEYKLGKPEFHGYNSEVIRHLLAFYNYN